VNVLVVGAGRMGLRHLRGLAALDAGVAHVVDPRPEARAGAVELAQQVLGTAVETYAALDEVPLGEIDAAILAETAEGRLERFERVAGGGVGSILLEKPLEQSRRRVARLRELALGTESTVHCNHYRRTLRFYERFRTGGPLRMHVVGGAYGLACNGVHWIDFARHLSGDEGGTLLYGEIERERIGSGRGGQFCDFGGRGVFAFGESRLVLDCFASSSAPTSMTLTQQSRHWQVDLATDRGVLHEREESSEKPSYLYGQDYRRTEIEGAEAVDLADMTRLWLASVGGGVCPLPTLEEAAVAHDLLFDLLETTGDTTFPIT
jgi:predicted dehydrogenase